MSEVKVFLYLGNANVSLNLNVELLRGFPKENLKDIVCQLFPHLDTYAVDVELKAVEEKQND